MTLVVIALSFGVVTPLFAAPARTYAVLPTEHVRDAKPDQAEWLEEKLLAALREEGQTLLPAERIRAVMAERGITSHRACDTKCLAALGKALGADRVVAPWLSLQRNFTKSGVAWVWHFDQVDVATGTAWGAFEKLCLCPKSWWDGIARYQVKRMVAYDPATVVRVPVGTPPAAVTPGPEPRPANMVFVPAGPFVMGTEMGEWNDEQPPHLVHLKSYWIDRTEVSNADYAQCVEARKCRPSPYRNHKVLGLPNHPVAGPNWHDAVAYCEFAGKRLPTEAEWEKAARGTDEREFPWGNEWDPARLNHKSDSDGYALSAPVGSFPAGASPYGALDMAGNQWEWTADYYSVSWYRRSGDRDPTGPERGSKRAMRGGSWMYDPPFFHSTHNRSPGRPHVHKKYVGFRCAKSVN